MVTPHDKLASDTVAKSLKFVDGHCVVGMPWKRGRTLLLDNYSLALQCLQSTRDFKNPGRGEEETRPEVTFPVSDEERMRLAFSPALENAA